MDLYQRLTISGRRTAAITRLRMELSGHDRQRKEYFSDLGERIDELRRSGQISDAGLLVLLEENFGNIDRINKKIQETMDAIREFNLRDSDGDQATDSVPEEEISQESENLLDSFGVL